MWTSLGVTAIFVVLLLLWWTVVTDGEHKASAVTAPLGVLVIAAVFIVVLYLLV